MNVKKNKLCTVNFWACGEPLIDKELVIQAIKLFKDAEVMDIFMHTNGLLLDEETSKKIIESGITYLCISIDAATSETYKNVRGGDFNKLLDNINSFLKIKGNRELPILRVSFLPTETNFHEIQMFEEYWKDKVDLVEIQDYTYVNGGPKKVDNIQVSDDKIKYSFGVYAKGTKRMAIIDPNILSKGCREEDVQVAIKNNDSFNKYKSIKNYWNKI